MIFDELIQCILFLEFFMLKICLVKQNTCTPESVKSWFAAICLHRSTKKKEANTPVNPKQCPTSIKRACVSFTLLHLFQVDGDAAREVRCFFCASDMFEKMGLFQGVPLLSPETNSHFASENRPKGPQNESIARWWFQIFFNFHPFQGKIPILTNIFQMGCSTTNQILSSPNHQFSRGSRIILGSLKVGANRTVPVDFGGN